MDRHDPFTLTFSNESTIYSNNTLYSFRTSINPPLNLPLHQWEVAMTKMTIPQTRNIFMPESEFEIRIDTYYEGKKDKFDMITINVKVESKFYHSIEDLVKWLSHSIVTAATKIYISRPYLFDIRHGRYPGANFEMTIQNNRVYLSALTLTGIPNDQIQFSYFKVTKGRELWALLGFNHLRLNRTYDLPLNAKYPPAIAEENSTLLLFTPNLVIEQFLGDTMRPLLELIPYNINSSSSYNVFEQRYPVYKTIFGGYINNIQIELVDIDNKPLFFESGKLQIELHFRQCQTSTKW